MEKTPLDLLEHHLEVLKTNREVAEKEENFEYAQLLFSQINNFADTIEILKTLNLRGERATKRLFIQK